MKTQNGTVKRTSDERQVVARRGNACSRPDTIATAIAAATPTIAAAIATAKQQQQQ